ncbi:hypothetical protein H6G06_07120 [Anabaena sphaerica FACHB-251]|uniref:Uncharacterized protein n=1 Tax=Anabaena sphaerica FACHB-251 TaxID=2692883 RepID=A0A926WGX2_9NOST|nr:hypothetical protein [Anabaena sphaerica]MBD2293261.1 hypothetical protein [Anabaena sphaerica FACHB-251]
MAHTTNAINANCLQLSNKHDELGEKVIFMGVWYFKTFANTQYIDIMKSPDTAGKSCIGISIFIKLSTKKYKIKSEIGYKHNLMM